MQIQIESRHMKVTEAISNHIHKRVDNLTKYFDGILNIHVVLNVENHNQQIAEIVCAVIKHEPLVARSTHDDLYNAIDEAAQKMKVHLVHHKEKQRSHKK